MGAQSTKHTKFSSGNDVFVWTAKPSYVSGETVTGTINLNCMRQFPSTGVYVSVKGVEKTYWEEDHTRQVQDGHYEDGRPRYRIEHYTVKRKGENKFFDQKICIHPWPGFCHPGQYQWPFSFKLPDGLPGVFEEEGHRWGIKYKAKTKYRIKGEVECSDGSEIKHKQKFILYERLLSSIEPQMREQTSNIYVCCCLNRGSVTMKCSFDKNAYVPGETAQVLCNVHNESTSEITAIKTSLMRRVRFKAKGGHHFQTTETVAQARYGGVAAAESESKNDVEAVDSGERYIPLQLLDMSEAFAMHVCVV